MTTKAMPVGPRVLGSEIQPYQIGLQKGDLTTPQSSRLERGGLVGKGLTTLPCKKNE